MWLNTLKPGVVKFTANLSFNQVEFLDLLIKIENGKLRTDLQGVPQNSLRFSLCHFSAYDTLNISISGIFQ